jgi:tetratricopeptide (TPR) repeat protein
MAKEDQMLENGTSQNKELFLLERELESWHARGLLSELGVYLYAMVLKDLQRKEEAKKLFIYVLNLLPTFWSAWLELARLLDKDSIVFIT